MDYTEADRQARLLEIERQKERLGLAQLKKDFSDSLKPPIAPHTRKSTTPKVLTSGPPRQSARLVNQPRPSYKEDPLAADKKILSRLSAAGFVMASSQTPAKDLSGDKAIMELFRTSNTSEGVSETKLRRVAKFLQEQE